MVSTAMSTSQYFECWLQADDWGDRRLYDPERKPLGLVLTGRVWKEASTAVYIAVDSSNSVHYVGSVCRQSLSGIRDRMKGHERTLRFNQWQGIYVIPLLQGTPEARVRAIEGEIGFILNPPGNIRLPARPRP